MPQEKQREKARKNSNPRGLKVSIAVLTQRLYSIAADNLYCFSDGSSREIKYGFNILCPWAVYVASMP